MENWQIVLLVVLGYLFLSLLIGLVSGRRATDSTEGYVAGDRTLGFLVLYFIMGASIQGCIEVKHAPALMHNQQKRTCG